MSDVLYKKISKLHLFYPEKYELAELDRKKPKVVRRGFTSSFIRYQSTGMPLIQEVKSSEDVEMEEPNVEVDITQVRYARCLFFALFL